MVDWERVARANLHPVKLGILDLLSIDGGRELSPKEISFELRAPLSKVSYHVSVLRKQGFLELVRTEPRRGAVEHYYCVAEAA